MYQLVVRQTVLEKMASSFQQCLGLLRNLYWRAGQQASLVWLLMTSSPSQHP